MNKAPSLASNWRAETRQGRGSDAVVAPEEKGGNSRRIRRHRASSWLVSRFARAFPAHWLLLSHVGANVCLSSHGADKGTAETRIARSVWSAWSLLPLWCARDRSKAPADWTHSKRFAWQFTHKNPRSLRTTSTVAAKGTTEMVLKPIAFRRPILGGAAPVVVGRFSRRAATVALRAYLTRG